MNEAGELGDESSEVGDDDAVDEAAEEGLESDECRDREVCFLEKDIV